MVRESGAVVFQVPSCYTVNTMFDAFWHDYLYQPLFNFLIWMYNNWTDQNLGWAIVWLTIIIRIAVLPFTLVTERDKIRNRALMKELGRVEKAYHNDPVLQKEEIRKVLKQRKVRPWAKIIVLGVQLLVLILLYQVFLRGITGEKISKILYPSINFPGAINTDFFGFDLGASKDTLWAGAVAIFLMAEIYFEYKKRGVPLQKPDLMYFLFFPLAVFLLLWYLPMVKSLFVLTSLVFSVIIYQFSKLLFSSKTSKEHHV